MKKLVLISISLIFFFILVIFFSFAISQDCKTFKIFKHVADFGTGQLGTCISKSHIGTNLKKSFGATDKMTTIINYPYFYDLLRSIKRTYITPNNRLDHLSTNSDQIEKNSIKQINKETINNIDNEIPFIKGILNQQFSNSNLNLDQVSNNEYNNWFRSHGGNWNSKFNDGNKINKKNISKLKLLWKYSSIKKSDKNFNNKWKLNVEVNPIFINGKLILTTADWKIVAIDVLTGKIIWELQSIFLPARRGILAVRDEKLALDILYINVGSRIYKINIDNGKKIRDFGENGSVNASTLVAPMIYKNNLLIMSSSSVLILILKVENI